MPRPRSDLSGHLGALQDYFVSNGVIPSLTELGKLWGIAGRAWAHRVVARLKEEGHARAVGVSNFPSALLHQAVAAAPVPLACVQVEYHPLLGQAPVLDAARAGGLALTAYSPVAKNKVAEQPVLRQVAQKHGASPAQVSLAWLLSQDGVAAIPKAQGEDNQRANLEATRLRLDGEDLAAIARLPKDQRQVNPGFAPAWDEAA